MRLFMFSSKCTIMLTYNNEKTVSGGFNNKIKIRCYNEYWLILNWHWQGDNTLPTAFHMLNTQWPDNRKWKFTSLKTTTTYDLVLYCYWLYMDSHLQKYLWTIHQKYIFLLTGRLNVNKICSQKTIIVITLQHF